MALRERERWKERARERARERERERKCRVDSFEYEGHGRIEWDYISVNV